MIFSRLSIRTKIAVLMTFLLALVSLAVYLYFPARLHRQMVASVEQKSAAMTSMAAYTVASGLHDNDPPAVAAALNGIRGNPDVVYYVLLDKQRQPFPSGIFNDRIARDANFERVPMQPVVAPQHVLQGGQSVRRASPEVLGGRTADGGIYQSMMPVRHQGRVIGWLYTGMSLDRANADA